MPSFNARITLRSGIANSEGDSFIPIPTKISIIIEQSKNIITAKNGNSSLKFELIKSQFIRRKLSAVVAAPTDNDFTHEKDSEDALFCIETVLFIPIP